MSVEWHVIATPDPQSAEAGALPFETRISFGPKLIDSRFTGAGCLFGPFPSPTVSIQLTEGAAYLFRATSRKEDGSAITWRGTLRDSAIAGEMLLALPGEPITRAAAERDERIKIDLIRQRYAVKNSRGELVNAAELDALEQDVRTGRNGAIARGRTLRFTFKTRQTKVSPAGAWPTTAPVTGPPRTQEPNVSSTTSAITPPAVDMPDLEAQLNRLRTDNTSLALELKRTAAKLRASSRSTAYDTLRLEQDRLREKLAVAQQEVAELREEVRELRKQLSAQHASQE